MVFKIKTSKNTMEIFEEIGRSEFLQPFCLSKIAISLSLKKGEKLSEHDFGTDNLGLELNRQTITGEYDTLFKALVQMNEKKYLDESVYFQKYLKAHLDRGAKLLLSEFKYNRDLILGLISDGSDGI